MNVLVAALIPLLKGVNGLIFFSNGPHDHLPACLEADLGPARFDFTLEKRDMSAGAISSE
jgi:hypothetical protein